MMNLPKIWRDATPTPCRRGTGRRAPSPVSEVGSAHAAALGLTAAYGARAGNALRAARKFTLSPCGGGLARGGITVRAPHRRIDCVLDGRLTSEGIIGNRKLGRLQPLDLVADARGLLEFEIARGDPHALLELGNMGAEIVSDRHRVLGKAGIDEHMVALIRRSQDVGDVLLDARRRNAVRAIELLLLLTAALGFRHRALHRPRNMISIQNDFAVDIARRPPDGLDQRS